MKVAYTLPLSGLYGEVSVGIFYPATSLILRRGVLWDKYFSFGGRAEIWYNVCVK